MLPEFWIGIVNIYSADNLLRVFLRPVSLYQAGWQGLLAGPKDSGDPFHFGGR